jgi:hypothetical protein
MDCREAQPIRNEIGDGVFLLRTYYEWERGNREVYSVYETAVHLHRGNRADIYRMDGE